MLPIPVFLQQFRVIKQLGHFLKEAEEGGREIFFIFQTSLLKVLILPTFFSLSNIHLRLDLVNMVF